jgi:hypothetical protein
MKEQERSKTMKEQKHSLVDSSSPGGQEKLAAKSGLTLKSVVISLVIIAIAAANNPPSVNYHPFDTLFSYLPFLNPTAGFVLIVMMLLTFVVKRFTRFELFTRAEWLTTFVMITIGSTMVYAGHLFAFKIMEFPFYRYGLEEKRMFEYFTRISPLVIPKDQTAIIDALNGQTSVPWSVWIVPLIMYAILGLSFYMVSLFMVTIVRKNWTEVQNLQFPLATPVVAMTEPGKDGNVFGEFWKNRVAWIGLGIALIVGAINGLNAYYPQVPKFGLDVYVGNLFGSSSFGVSMNRYPPLRLVLNSPLLLGIAFFIPSRILVSIMFFGLFYKLYQWIFVASGLMPLDVFSFIVPYGHVGNQTMGALLALTASLLWVSRDTMKEIIRAAFTGKSKIDFSSEPASPKVAVFGGLLGFLYIVFFYSTLHYAGVFWTAFAFIMVFSASFVLMRVRADAGIPTHNLIGGFLLEGAIIYLPTSLIGVPNIVFTGQIYRQHILLGYHNSLAATTLESMILADHGGIRRKSMSWAIGIASVVGLTLGIVFMVKYFYLDGAFLSKSGNTYFWSGMTANEWARRIETGLWDDYNDPLKFILFFAVGGIGVTALLTYLYSKFSWWPLHPIGYIFAGNYEVVQSYLGHFLLAYIIKALIMRYRGNTGLQKAKPLFTGLVAGHLLSSTFWGFIEVIRRLILA